MKVLRGFCRPAQVLEERTPLLRKAADAARAGGRSGAAVRAWRGAHAWVEDSALFYCLTHFDDALRGVAWWQWPEPLRWGTSRSGPAQACSSRAVRQGACFAGLLRSGCMSGRLLQVREGQGLAGVEVCHPVEPGRHGRQGASGRGLCALAGSGMRRP